MVMEPAFYLSLVFGSKFIVVGIIRNVMSFPKTDTAAAQSTVSSIKIVVFERLRTAFRILAM